MTNDSANTWQMLDDNDCRDLILCAIAGELKAHHGNHRVLRLAEAGLLTVKSSDEYYTLYTLAPTGCRVLLSAPDEYRHGRFPRPADVQQAKRAAQAGMEPDTLRTKK